VTAEAIPACKTRRTRQLESPSGAGGRYLVLTSAVDKRLEPSNLTDRLHLFLAADGFA
jgi:hypothetical protein